MCVCVCARKREEIFILVLTWCFSGRARCDDRLDDRSRVVERDLLELPLEQRTLGGVPIFFRERRGDLNLERGHSRELRVDRDEHRVKVFAH